MTKSALLSKRDRIYSARRSSINLKCKRVRKGLGIVHSIRHKKKEPAGTDTLSIKDIEAFFNAIENPPKPNERVKAAMKLYQESVIDV